MSTEDPIPKKTPEPAPDAAPEKAAPEKPSETKAEAEVSNAVTEAAGEPAPKKPTFVPMVLIAGAAVSTLVSILVVYARLSTSIHNVVKQREDRPLMLIEQAKLQESYGRPEKAFGLYQLAIVNALTEERRLDAGLAMAEFLVKQIPTDPPSYVIQIRQYADAILDKETRPGNRFRAHRALLEAARAAKDMENLLKESLIIEELTGEPDEKARLLMICLDTAIDSRDFDRAQTLLKKGEYLADLPQWKDELLLRKARIGHRTISDDNWARAEAKRQGRELTDDLRKSWIDPVTEQYRAVVASGRTAPATQALFHLAELMFESGRYDDCIQYIEDFLKRESGDHQSDVLMIMIRIARTRGEARRAERLISVFLERFPWNNVVMEEFLTVVRQAEERGYVREALALVDRYKMLPSSKSGQAQLLSIAATLAADAGLTNRADQYNSELLALNPPDALAIRALLAKASICRQRGDWPGATDWLLRYLREFPYEASRGDALFDLYDCQKKMSSGPIGLLRLAMAAVTERPEDPRTVPLLLEVAETLENGGMYAIAQQQYNRVALLHYVTPEGGSSTNLSKAVQSSTLARAQLGSARCFLKIDEPLKAERILRDLCTEEDPSPVRSEAAYLWAIQASEERQFAEARRRLGLIDSPHAAPAIQKLAAIEQMLIEVAVAERSVDDISDILLRIEGLPAVNHGDFIRRTYRVCFDRMEKDRSMVNLRKFIDAAAVSPHAGILPVTEFYLRLGKLILAESGVDAFSLYMQEVGERIRKGGVVFPAGVDIVTSVAAGVEKQTRMVGGFL